jgi:gamma-glutamylcyclotransferase (GGCT)/AIG2-like uncharacterized protein YtfP
VTLFCYGSLEFAEVMRAVTGRAFAHERARLDDWQRRRLRGRSFPGLRPRAGASTPGTVWHGIDPRSAERLDRFEGALYERRRLPVRTAAGVIDADVYVTPAGLLRELSAEPWDRLRFARESLADFVRRTRRR